jgi:hypothetical protein
MVLSDAFKKPCENPLKVIREEESNSRTTSLLNLFTGELCGELKEKKKGWLIHLEKQTNYHPSHTIAYE